MLSTQGPGASSGMARASDKSWRKICDDYGILSHDFAQSPFEITAKQIKTACQNFTETSEKEVRILAKQDSRESRPKVFEDNGLFLLPIWNGAYAIIKGEGYVDIPEIQTGVIPHESRLLFDPDTSKVGDSEMQHLDLAYATSLIRTFAEDSTLVLTIRGRKYTPEFSFVAGDARTPIRVKSVQTEVDAGYEGKDKVVLVEAKNTATTNVIIRQLYYPYRQWQQNTDKPVLLLFFEKRGQEYCFWEFRFADPDDYNSVHCTRSARYSI